MREFDAEASLAHAGPAPGHVTRSVQAPDCVVCPAHGPVLRICPTHGLTTVIRQGPLESADDLTGLARGATSEADSVVDTLSIINSFTMSLSRASSPVRSTYATPERASSPLPNVGGATQALCSAPTTANVASQAPAPALALAPTLALAPALALVNVASQAPAPSLVHVASRAPAPSLANVASQALTPAPVNPGTNANYVPYITDNNDSDNYYIVTRGRTVGVFDNSYVDYSLGPLCTRSLTRLT